MNNSAIILFDGVCNLCNGVVTFIIRRDPKGYFRFASLQSEAARKILGRDAGLETILLVENEVVYSRSAAALRIAKKLSGLWPLLYVFIVVPRPIRDVVYNFIARNRYRWFGKQAACMVPTAELKRRFLE